MIENYYREPFHKILQVINNIKAFISASISNKCRQETIYFGVSKLQVIVKYYKKETRSFPARNLTCITSILFNLYLGGTNCEII